MEYSMPTNIKEVYEIFENIRTRLDDSDIVSEISNYFNVDQFAGFCESLIDDYDLDPVEMGVVNYIPEEDVPDEDDLNSACEEVREWVNDEVDNWCSNLENIDEDMEQIYRDLANAPDYFANEFDSWPGRDNYSDEVNDYIFDNNLDDIVEEVVNMTRMYLCDKFEKFNDMFN